MLDGVHAVLYRDDRAPPIHDVFPNQKRHRRCKQVDVVEPLVATVVGTLLEPARPDVELALPPHRI